MMMRPLILALATAAMAASFAASDADAGRLGGGKSLGAQRQSIAPPVASQGPAANPVMPAQSGTSAAKPAASAAAAAQPSGASRWLGPVAGIAAGLGLAALLAHFGLPEGFASVLLLGLVAFGAVLLFRLLAARRAPAAAGPMPYGGASNAQRSRVPDMPQRVEPMLAPAPSKASISLPAGFDAERFLREAKTQFRRLQTAWDAGDRKALADVMTPDMAAEIVRELGQRGAHEATVVISLDAELVEVTTEPGAHWASVRFTGLVREDGAPQPVPLDEVWNLTKPVDGSSGWLLAGIRQAA
jgi:predicted lipid-binding transport protein (Tim44 family)